MTENHPISYVVLQQLPSDELILWQKAFQIKRRVLRCRVMETQSNYLIVSIKVGAEDATVYIPHHFVTMIIQGKGADKSVQGFAQADNT